MGEWIWCKWLCQASSCKKAKLHMVMGASCSSRLEKVLPYLPCEDYESALGFSQICGVAEEEEKKIQAAIVS